MILDKKVIRTLFVSSEYMAVLYMKFIYKIKQANRVEI